MGYFAPSTTCTFALSMRNKKKHTIYRVISLLLIAVMAMLTFNQSVYLHTHKLNDGTVVTHAHPYQKTNNSTPTTSHQHSKKDYVFIGLFKLLFIASLYQLSILLKPHFHKQYTNLYIHIDKCDSKLILGRAPPAINSLHQ